MIYFLFAALPYIAQILLLIHIIKTGRPAFWIFLVIFVPYLGGVVYFFAELLPDLLKGRTGHAAGRALTRVINPGGEIRRLEDQLRLQNTVSNKLALAAAFSEAGRHDEAISLYHECLTGPYANDRAILFPLAKCLYFSGQTGASQVILDTIKKEKEFTLFEEQLLDILVREAQGSNVTGDFAGLYDRTRNFEAGYYYVRNLVRAGEREKAKSVIADMKDTLRNFRQFRGTMGREWLIKSEAALNS